MPIIHLLSVLIYFVIWTLGIVYLMSTGTVDPSSNLPPYGQFLYSNQTLGLFAFQLFALFWMIAFFAACTDFVLGSSVAIWYFKQMDHPVSTSYHRLARCIYITYFIYFCRSYRIYCVWKFVNCYFMVLIIPHDNVIKTSQR